MPKLAPIPITCNCGYTSEVDGSFAGKRARCPKCREMVLIPAAVAPSADGDAPAAVMDEEPEPLAKLAPRAATPPPPPLAPLPMPGALADYTPPGRHIPGGWTEPWYYGAFGASAWATFLVGLVGSVFLFFLLAEAAGAKPTAAQTIAVVAWPLGLLISSTLTACGAMVGLDAARHVRAVRQGGN